MTTLEARKAILADLEAGGYIKEIEPLKHDVGTCYRCHTNIEPMVSKQWFVKMDPLAGPAIDAVENGDIKFVPERFKKNYMSWMRGSRDWCISRQLWWGHRIPAWYCDDCGATTVSKEDPCKCSHCGSENIHQDSDTLDTWFSSALWPFSTLGWPDKTEDLEHYYPTNTLVTGYDIIGFWVSRMIFSGLAYTDKAPFDTVLIHGLVRDAQGRKMSKSLGNGIDPLEVIDEYGADALRFTLATGNSPGNDMRFSDEKVKASRNFANKLWNAARFVLMYLTDDFKYNGLPSDLAVEDEWIVSKVNTLAKDVTDNLEKYELGIAIQKLYDFIWDVFCDWYIEIAKIRLQGDDEKAKDTAKSVLVYVLTDILKLLHPFMPFITTELWNNTCDERKCKLINFAWPKDAAFDTAAMDEVDWSIELISAIRSLRAEMNIPAGAKLTVYLKDGNAQSCANLQSFNQIICSLARLDKLECFAAGQEISKDMVSGVFREGIILLPLKGVVDFAAEKERLKKELDNLNKYLEGYARKLSNPSFVERAPAKVVEEEKRRQAEAMENKAKIEEALQRIANF